MGSRVNGYDMKTRSILEAILFVAERPIPAAELAEVTERPHQEIAEELDAQAQD